MTNVTLGFNELNGRRRSFESYARPAPGLTNKIYIDAYVYERHVIGSN